MLREKCSNGKKLKYTKYYGNGKLNNKKQVYC